MKLELRYCGPNTGRVQLYMEMAAASIGVWFNGMDHLYLCKVVSADGTRMFEEIPNRLRRPHVDSVTASPGRPRG